LLAQIAVATAAAATPTAAASASARCRRRSGAVRVSEVLLAALQARAPFVVGAGEPCAGLAVAQARCERAAEVVGRGARAAQPFTGIARRVEAARARRRARQRQLHVDLAQVARVQLTAVLRRVHGQEQPAVAAVREGLRAGVAVGVRIVEQRGAAPRRSPACGGGPPAAVPAGARRRRARPRCGPR